MCISEKKSYIFSRFKNKTSLTIKINYYENISVNGERVKCLVICVDILPRINQWDSCAAFPTIGLARLRQSIAVSNSSHERFTTPSAMDDAPPTFDFF